MSPDSFGREVKSSEVPIAERRVIGPPPPRQKGSSRAGELSRVISTVGQRPKGNNTPRLKGKLAPEVGDSASTGSAERVKPTQGEGPVLRSSVKPREIPIHRVEATRRYYDSTRGATRRSGSATVTRREDGSPKITSFLDETDDFEPSGF